MSEDFHPPLTANAERFSWSLSRDNLFKFCQLAYFFHYYAALGGHYQHCAEPVRLLHRLKQLVSCQQWENNIFSESVREYFLTKSGDDYPVDSDALFNLAHRRFAQGKRSVLLEEWRNDAKLTNLFETYYGEKNFERLFDSAWQNISDQIKTFTGSECFQYLQRLDALAWKRFKPPFEFKLGETAIWLSPDLCWSAQGGIYFLSFTNTDTYNLDQAALYKIFAQTVRNIPPDKTFVCNYNIATGNWTFIDNVSLNISATLEKIDFSTAAMRAKISEYNTVDQDNFEVYSEHCPQCRFRHYCASLRSTAGFISSHCQ
ncbi:MAG: hypothetical protein WC071_05850 [Victivallaceae bacterium]